MRLLFVHEVNYLRKVVYETQEYPERLAARGHEVAYIDFPEGEPRKGVRRLLDFATERRDGVARTGVGGQIQLITPGRVLAPPFDRLAASVTHVPAVWQALRHGRYDAVVLYAIPTNGWQTILLAHRLGVPVLHRAIDVPTEMRRTVFRPLVQRAAQYVYSRADGISTHTGPLRDYCIQLGARPGHVSIEYPGFNLEHFSPGPRDPELQRRYGLQPADRVVVFMGEFHYFSAVDWLVEAFAPYLQAHRDVKLLLLGNKPAVGGTSPDDIQRVGQRMGVSDAVKTPGRIEYKNLPAHLRLADVAVVPLRPTVQAETALPSKTLQYLACGVPTVSAPLPGLQSVLPREDMGIRYRPLDHSFVDAVGDMLADQPARAALARAARATTEQLFDWDRCIEAFEAAIEGTIERFRAR